MSNDRPWHESENQPPRNDPPPFRSAFDPPPREDNPFGAAPRAPSGGRDDDSERSAARGGVRPDDPRPTYPEGNPYDTPGQGPTAPPPGYGGYGPPPGYGGYPPHADNPYSPPQGGYPRPPMSPSDERLWAMLCHLLGLLSIVGGILGAGILGPLIIWLIKKDESKFVDYNGRESINFQITFFIFWIASLFLACVYVGFLLFPVVLILQVVFTILATIETNKGNLYRYPICFRFIPPPESMEPESWTYDRPQP